ncbi:MAG TPA: enoyl-CoA hydratase/isomerase family protein [Allosphingosinicella sp.]
MFRLSQESQVARLTLDRPEARNAIPAAGWRRLEAAVGEVAKSDARLLVVAGKGGAFCAGADLNDFAAMKDDERARTAFRTDMRSAFDALAGLPIPTIAAISGPCYGAGVALAIACDLRVATEAARFAITPAKMGISFPQEDVHRLVSLVGKGQAARLLFSAATIDAAEAARIGLVELVGTEAEIVAVILANESESLSALKQAIARAADGRRSDPEMDRRFDDLIAGETLARRLEGRKRT